MVKWGFFSLVGCLAGITAGCGGSAPGQIAKASKDIQGAIQQVQQSAAQAAGISEGSIELTLDAPLKTARCFARFTPKGASRPAVVQLMSSASAESEEFPSVLLWATGDAASATDLVGKTLEGHLFVQREPGRGTWSSSTLQPIAIKVVQADLLSITCEVADVEMAQADGDGAVKASGKFVGLWNGKASAPAGAK